MVDGCPSPSLSFVLPVKREFFLTTVDEALGESGEVEPYFHRKRPPGGADSGRGSCLPQSGMRKVFLGDKTNNPGATLGSHP